MSGVNICFSDADDSVKVECGQKSLTEVVSALSRLCGGKAETEVRIVKLEKIPIQGQGHGRLKRLDKEMTIKEVVEATKKHCGIEHLRLGLAKNAQMGE